MDRRAFLLTAASLPFATAAFADTNPFAALEAKAGGRLGVAAFDTSTGRRLAYRVDERFPMCSTFKLLAVAAILHNVDQGNERLDRFVDYGKADLLDYAPITKQYLARGGMSLGELCAAAIEWSDNTAANLILTSLGGPQGVTAYARTLGDNVTRLDRNEPSLNSSIPGDPRDTTSPAAMLADVKSLIQGTALSPASRDTLNSWLMNCQTATGLIPAGLPSDWTSGNKTGSGANGSTNDVAVVNAPNRAPMFVAAYYTGSKASDQERKAVLSQVGQIMAQAFSG